jgi:hypothetical protein
MWAALGANGPYRPFKPHAAKVSFKPFVSDAALRMNGCFQQRAKTFNNCLGFEQGLWQRKTEPRLRPHLPVACLICESAPHGFEEDFPWIVRLGFSQMVSEIGVDVVAGWKR